MTNQKFGPFVSVELAIYGMVSLKPSSAHWITMTLSHSDGQGRSYWPVMASFHHDYVRDRLGRYEQAFSEVQQRRLGDAFSQAIELWNKGLFFEAHERWETTWQKTTGERRMAIKGLIKAAGVYVHMEQGHELAAKTLAGKALALLREHGRTLSSLLDLRELLEKLETQHPVPPQLSNRGQRSALK